MTQQNKKQRIVSSDPIYSIGVAAKLLDVHPRTLRIYEAEGLLQPSYIGVRRLYSQDDLDWIACLRSMIHEDGISIPGLKRLLNLIPCWEITNCSDATRAACKAKGVYCAKKKNVEGVNCSMNMTVCRCAEIN